MDPKTIRKKVQNIPTCNEKLYKEVAYMNKISPKQVEEIIHYVSKFTAETIKRGAFETVMLPGFGKITVKEKSIQHLEAVKTFNKLPI